MLPKLYVSIKGPLRLFRHHFMYFSYIKDEKRVLTNGIWLTISYGAIITATWPNNNTKQKLRFNLCMTENGSVQNIMDKIVSSSKFQQIFSV